MKKKIKFFAYNLNILYIYVFGILLLFSCENSDVSINENKNSIHNVSKEKAVNVAQVFLSKYDAYRTSKTNDFTKTIEDVFTFKTMSNENAFYAINYEEGGFVVVSADNRASPIRAFSDEGKFSNNIDEIPDPVVSWMETEKESIQILKDSQLEQIDEIQLEWDYLLTITGNPNLCETLMVQKGPLLQTNWGQWNTYNNANDTFCNNSSGHAPTGCVATAMAQVMKFHQKPSYLNWALMPNGYGTTHTQSLMFWIGQSVDMNYSCEGSGVLIENAVTSFHNSFGYNNATYLSLLNYNVGIAFSQIGENKPVILRGGRKRGGIYLPWNDYADGHAWVSDGFLIVILRAPDIAGICQSYGFRFLHMNWGWNGEYNAWFNENHYNPGLSTYNYGRGILYNIY